MSKTLRTSLIVIGIVVAGAALILVGMYFGRFNGASPWGWHGFVSPEFNTETSDAVPYPYGGMMSFSTSEGGDYPHFGYMDPSMMSGYGMMGGTGRMMSSLNSSLLGIEPISLVDAEAAIRGYLDIIQDDNLDIGEIMVFDNHAYAQIVEIDTGIGALELLVDPVTLAVSPEPGPNMMWNVKYSPMSGFGEFGLMGMMGTFGSEIAESIDEMMGATEAQDISADLPLSAEGAVEIAQQYLDAFVPGAAADEHADPFYGYYTIHILRDGETVGMLSVNGYTRQVFLHSWHGDLVAMGDDE